MSSRKVGRRHLAALVVLVLGSAALIGGAAATPGPGGWDNVGTGPSGSSALNGSVYALNADAPGALYVGGSFTSAGGVAGADHIAKWNTSSGSWSALGGSNLNGAVNAIAYRAGKVYVGGVFTNAGGNPDLDFLAVWDGTKWGTVCNASGAAITGNVSALQIIGSTIYVGGSFANGARIADADYLVACDLNTGAARATTSANHYFSGGVNALTADSRGRLYAGGGFSSLEGVPAAGNVAYLDGAGWHAMGSGSGQGGSAIGTFVRSLAANGTDVYVGTDAVNVANIPQADHVARWNGSAWSAVGSNSSGGDGWFPTSSFIYALATSGSRVFAGGSFQNANGDATNDFVASYDGSGWHPIGSSIAGNGALQGQISALAVSGGKLYAGGNFTNAGGNGLADALASISLANLGGGGGGGGGGNTPSGTSTGKVTVNGRPFTGGTIPFGAKVDVTNGVLLLKTGTGTVRLFGAGVFSRFRLLKGTDGKKPTVELRLVDGNFAACKRKTSSVSKSPTVVRQLWGNGKGSFRTRGRYASASVRGTIWLTADRCDGTLAKVTRGRVQVADLVKKQSVFVSAGKSYLAKAG